MSQNWMRHFELQLVDENGQGIELSDFKVTFTIDWFNISSAARVGTFKIYNLSADTVNRITGQEFSKVRLIAGYDGIAPEVSASDVGTVREVDAADVGQSDGRNYGLIFSGEIRYSVTGKDSPIDSYVLIQAADTDLAFATSITSQTLAAGYTVADVNRALMKDFEAKGATEGLTPEMPTTVFPRGRVLFGMTRHLMDNVAGQCGATWQFVDGQRQMVANNEYVHDAIVLNSATGLIGMPQQTIGNGVNVRALINPNIRVNGLIHWIRLRYSAPRCRTTISRWLVVASTTRILTAISRSAAPRLSLPASQRMAFILCAGLCTLAIQGARRGTWI